ncbi:MAG TPA: NUDIX domain-containing protein [Pirellulales bacterium]|nr:NUDIX domain-containing protein [Pirellulales bacterium]
MATDPAGITGMVESAGALVYRRGEQEWEVLLVHPSGNYNRRAPWSIPKGLPEEGESLETAARRELLEETGIVAGGLVELGSIVYRKSRKRVHCFAGPAPDAAAPCCASWEIDQAEFLSLAAARERIHPDQAEFVDRLVAHLAQSEQAE